MKVKIVFNFCRLTSVLLPPPPPIPRRPLLTDLIPAIQLSEEIKSAQLNRSLSAITRLVSLILMVAIGTVMEWLMFAGSLD